MPRVLIHKVSGRLHLWSELLAKFKKHDFVEEDWTPEQISNYQNGVTPSAAMPLEEQVDACRKRQDLIALAYTHGVGFEPDMLLKDMKLTFMEKVAELKAKNEDAVPLKTG